MSTHATSLTTLTIEQIAADFEIHPIPLSKWMRQSDADNRAKTGAAEPRKLRWRTRLFPDKLASDRKAADRIAGKPGPQFKLSFVGAPSDKSVPDHPLGGSRVPNRRWIRSSCCRYCGRGRPVAHQVCNCA